MKKQNYSLHLGWYYAIIFVSLLIATPLIAVNYPVIDTGQEECYNTSQPIDPPEQGEAFYGQDAQFNDQQIQFSYQDNEDGTISDLNTGLMWVQARGEKVTWAEGYTGAGECRTANYDDWRMPTIKELYSLIDFRGYIDPEGGEDGSIPYIDTDYFGFRYGDEDDGERIIDCQDWSATEYVHFTMNNDSTVFGVNFADGRIKGYPKYMRERENVFPNELYVRYVRGNPEYGINRFNDNDDNTITDEATGLMWSKDDSREGLNWEAALGWIESMNEDEYLGYSDWRLPNAKELQSIVDYSRAPAVTGSAAINPLFNCSEIEDESDGNDYPFYWTNTNHLDGPRDTRYTNAAYICFGRGLGWMQLPPRFEWELLDVHGAGAQRSDPKVGDPGDYPHGNGPQGDVIRIYNYIRLVRGQSEPYSSVNSDHGSLPNGMQLIRSYPNPFNSSITITYQIPKRGHVSLKLYSLTGALVWSTPTKMKSPGTHQKILNGRSLTSGLYLLSLEAASFSEMTKVMLIR